MPLDKNTTSNGVDLSEVDVSKLALVDKENLLDDLTKRLKDGIRQSFAEVLEDAKEDLSDIVTEGASPGGSAPGPRQSRQKSGGGSTAPDKKKQDEDFEKLRKVQHQAAKAVDKLMALQRKKDKDSRAKALKGNVYSNTGKRTADSLDEVAGEFHGYDSKELEEAKKRLSDIQEDIKFSTFGKEQEILSKQTAKLQDALAAESKQRATMLGKMAGYMTKNAINATSLITGMAGNSPLAGVMVKYFLDTVRKHREAGQKKQSDSLKMNGTLQKKLPRQQEPDNENPKIDREVLKRELMGIDSPDVRHATLENLHKSGQISDTDAHSLRSELLPPSFHPLTGPVAPTAHAPTPVTSAPSPSTGGAHGPAQLYSIANYNSRRPERVENEGNGVMDSGMMASIERLRKKGRHPQRDRYEESYEIGKRQEHEKLQRQIQEAEQKYAELSKDPKNSEGSDDIFNSPADNAKSELSLLRKKLGSIEKILEDIDKRKTEQDDQEKRLVQFLGQNAHVAPVLQMPKAAGNSVEHRVAAQPTSVRTLHENDNEPTLHPERIPNDQSGNVVSISAGKGFQKVEEQQLVELQEINKKLQKQIDSTDLANDAARRETKDDGGNILGADFGKKKKGGGLGGILGGLFGGVVEGIGSVFTRGALGKVGKFLGMGGKEEAAGGGMLSRLFGGGAKAAGGAVEAGKGVEGATGALRLGEGAAEGAEGAGIFGKMFGGLSKLGGVGKVAGKLGGIGRLAGKLALPLTIIMGIIDFFSAFMNAGAFLGKDEKKVEMSDRLGAGVGGVVKGLVGIIDFFLGLIGIKSDLGGFIGKGVGKMMSTVFKVIKFMFMPMILGFKALGKLINLVPWGKIEDFFQPLFDWFDALGNFFDKLTDFVSGDAGFKDVLSAVQGIADVFINVFTAVQDKIYGILDWLHIPHPKAIGGKKSGGASAAPSVSAPKAKAPTTPAPSTNAPVPVTGTPATSTPTPAQTVAAAPSSPSAIVGTMSTSPFGTSGRQWSPSQSQSVMGRFGEAASGASGAQSEYARIGALSAAHESRGYAGRVNEKSASRDIGGYSYGLYQMTTKAGNKPTGGTMVPFMKFLGQNYPDLSKELESAGGINAAIQGDPKFISTWKRLADSDPRFATAQHDFIGKTHYDPARQAANRVGLNLDSRGDAVKQMIFSTSVNGPVVAKKTLEEAFKGMSPEEVSKLSDEDVIRRFQAYKINHMDTFYASQIKKDPNIARNVQTRFSKETDELLASSRNEKRPQPLGGAPVVTPPSPVLVASAREPNASLVAQGGTNGMRMAKASTDSSVLMKTAMLDKPQNNNTVIAPSSSVVNTTHQTVDIRARNSESTYQRNMNAMFVAT